MTGSQPGAIVGDVDVAQLLVAAFVIFFFGLVLYLRREDKREGYPLIDPAGGGDGEGFPTMPTPKRFVLRDGDETFAPHPDPQPELAVRPAFPFPGAPLKPTGDPVVDAVGPAAYALRRETPTMYTPALPQVEPLRSLDGWSLVPGDPDPRGMAVVGDVNGDGFTDVLGRDGAAAGVVRELWVDQGVKIIRYLEIELDAALGGRRVLTPIHHTVISRRRNRVWVRALTAARFAAAPATADPDLVTAREEDRINAFYAGARFFDTSPLARRAVRSARA